MRIYVCGHLVLINNEPYGEVSAVYLFSLKSKKEIGKRMSLGQRA